MFLRHGDGGRVGRSLFYVGLYRDCQLWAERGASGGWHGCIGSVVDSNWCTYEYMGRGGRQAALDAARRYWDDLADEGYSAPVLV